MKFVIIKVEKGVPDLVDSIERDSEADAIRDFREDIAPLYYDDGIVYLHESGKYFGVRTAAGQLKFRVYLRWV